MTLQAAEAHVWPVPGEAPAPRGYDAASTEPSLARVIGGLVAAGEAPPARAAGERALMCAVLADAAACLSGWRRHPAPAAEARRWIESTDRDWPFSFENLCESLGLCVNRLRGCLLHGVPSLAARNGAPVYRAPIRLVPRRQAASPADDGDAGESSPGSEDGALTPRERDIVALIAAGVRTADVAVRLAISVPTVKKHLNNVFQKLGVKSRAELVGYAERIGLA